MQEFMIDTGEWKAFWARWRDTIDGVPGLKEEVLDRVGARIRNEVHNAIEVSGINDSRGRVKRWQNPHVGSGKGYVAVRADSHKVTGTIGTGYKDMETVLRYRGRESPMNAGALTNFLTSGHRVRGPSGRSKRYQPRARMTRVRGLDFYGKAKAETEKIAVQEAESMLREIKEMVGL